jgi:hypothetical protein
MVASPRDRGAPVELVVYHRAGHDFICRGHSLERDAADHACHARAALHVRVQFSGDLS